MQSLRLLAVLLLTTTPCWAQTPKRSLTQSDFDHWQSIAGPALSPDGRWVAYTLGPQVGDGEVVVAATTDGAERRFPRGYVGRPQLRPAADSGFRIPPVTWGADSRTLVFSVLPPADSVEAAARRKRGNRRAPHNGLGIFRVGTGVYETVPDVRSYRMARASGELLAYLMEPDSATGVSEDSATSTRRSPLPGSTLVIRNLEDGTEIQIPEVRSFALEDSARYLAYSVSSRTPATNGVYLRRVATGEVTTVVAGVGSFGRVVFDRSGRRFAFVSDHADTATTDPKSTVYLARIEPKAVALLAVATPDSAGPGYQIASRGPLRFTREGDALLLSLASVLPTSVPSDSLRDRAVLDLWHYLDPRLQPQQIREARRDRNRTYQAIYHPRERQVVQLADAAIPQVALGNDGRTAIGITQEPYRVQAMWGEGGSDIYLIPATNGDRFRIATHVPFAATLSPTGRFAIWFDEGAWHTYDTRRGTSTSLTAAAPDVHFERETWNTPSIPRPWGIAGWTEGEGQVLLYDRYDVWAFDPSGKTAPRMVTEGRGRAERTTFRIVDLDRDEPFLSPTDDLLLRAFNEDNKQSGFWVTRLDRTGPPRQILMSDHAWGTPSRAKDANTYLVTRSTFQEFPDLWTGPALDSLTKVSNANQQQAGITWGNVELVNWRSDDNVPLKGLLYTPEDFDPSRQYPMVVYFYEQLSNNLHNYVMTHPRNTIQPTWYVSNGYLVFFPDIAYTTGYPGPDAEKAIIPGVQSLLARGFVKPDGIGIAGQSWGGYQTAFVVTRSRLFKAAMAGAPVANMTSAYGGIRWGSGLARSFQYEKTQSRIGGSLWEFPMRYLENSPLFAADRIQTPLLIMHNDADGAVPWYQGIELFVALRRLGKESYLLNYNGESHNPTKRANQDDIARRTMEFFDHHLRGAPAPRWMTHGIPYLEKGRDQIGAMKTSMP